MDEEKLLQKVQDFSIDPRANRKARFQIFEEREQIEAAYRRVSEESFMAFTRGLIIASQTGPKVFDICMAPFQRKCFEDMAPSIEALRDGRHPKTRRFWIERTKKASKDADLAVIMIWLLAFAKRPFYIQVGAANKVQAAIVKERMMHLLHWNPWLNELVESNQWEVKSKQTMVGGGPMAKLHIMSSDIAGAHGSTPNLLVVNELSHVNRWEFVENLMDNADGVAEGMAIIATNAGIKGSKAEVWRKAALASDDWGTYVLAQPAPWHSKKIVEEARVRNGEQRWKRLWKGIWTSGKGDALNEEHIDRCFELNGKPRMLGPLLAPEPGWTYLGGLDLGISHDHCGLVILGVSLKEHRLKTAWWRAWEPDVRTGEVDLPNVRETCDKMNQVFKLTALWYDPHQAKLMAQDLIKKFVPMQEMTFSNPANLTKMATSFLQVVEAGKLECYDDEIGRLRMDFGKFNIVEKQYGYKLEAVSDEYGHADVGTALAICLPAAVDMLNRWASPSSEVVLFDDTGFAAKEPDEKEMESLPKELQAIYGIENESKKDYIRKNRAVIGKPDPFEKME